MIKGRPIRFIYNHHGRNRTGKDCFEWKGGRTTNNGYVWIYNPNHPRSNGIYVYEHILIAEKVLGKYLPDKAMIHHIDEDKTHNINSNLVICQDDGYHKLLHRRLRALKKCGHANWRKCVHCKKHDDPKNMYIRGRISYHRKCHSEYNNKLYWKKK